MDCSICVVKDWVEDQGANLFDNASHSLTELGKPGFCIHFSSFGQMAQTHFKLENVTHIF